MELVKFESETLHKPALPVSDDEDVSGLIAEMWRVMIENNGCGIAANQLGSLKRVIIINVDGYPPMTVINPELSNGKNKKNSREGCLSFPGVNVIKKRFSKITITGLDENGIKIKKVMRDMSAFCAQHEVDHLNGVTIDD